MDKRKKKNSKNKILRKRILVFVSIIVMLLYVCQIKVMAKIKADNKHRFTWINPVSGEEYWKKAEAGMKEAAEKYDVDVETIDIDQLDSDKYIYALRETVAANSEGILEVGWRYDDIELEIKKIIDAGTPVIYIDTDIEDSSRLCFIGSDNYEAGKLAGEEIVRVTGGQGCVGILRLTSVENQEKRLRGIEDVLKDYPEIQLINVNDEFTEKDSMNKNASMKRIQDMLEKYPDRTAVIGTNAYETVAAGAVVEAMGYSDKIRIVGFDDNEETMDYIKKQVIDATIVQQPEKMGYNGVKLLTELAEGKIIENSEIYTDLTVIRADDYKDEK